MARLTEEEALALKKGDNIFYKGKKYKVLNVRSDIRTVQGNMIVRIKATGNGETLYCLRPEDISWRKI